MRAAVLMAPGHMYVRDVPVVPPGPTLPALPVVHGYRPLLKAATRSETAG